MEGRAAVEAAEALAASATALAAALRGTGSADAGVGAGRDAGRDEDDPLRVLADDFLDGLAETSRIDAQVAALRVHLAAGYAGAAEAMAGPAVSPEDHTGQEMALIAEVACAMTVSERGAANLLVEAHRLLTALPLTLAALEAGTVSWQHARIMVDEASGLGPEGAQALEAHFLDPDAVNPARSPAGEMTAGRFRAKARIWRERHHPVSIEKRHAKCAADRRVLFTPDRDGMAWLSAYLPADTASGIWQRATAASRALQGPDEDRTLTQLRADNVATWLLGGSHPGPGNRDEANVTSGAGTVPAARPATAGSGTVPAAADARPATAGAGTVPAATPATDGVGTVPAATPATDGAGTVPAATPATDGAGTVPAAADATAAAENADPGGPSVDVPSPRAQVLITVPVMALLGITEEPAMLDGYGPIPPSMARQLIANGATSFHRVLIDPRDGAPLEIGRTSYPVTKAQRQWLRLRDGKCPFPGCNNQSLDNEADHILTWAKGGVTGISNLGQPCRRHHKLRHTAPWAPTAPGKNEPPGWISPAGRHYQSEHPDWEPPTLPDAALNKDPRDWPVNAGEHPEHLPVTATRTAVGTGACGAGRD